MPNGETDERSMSNEVLAHSLPPLDTVTCSQANETRARTRGRGGGRREREEGRRREEGEEKHREWKQEKSRWGMYGAEELMINLVEDIDVVSIPICLDTEDMKYDFDNTEKNVNEFDGSTPG